MEILQQSPTDPSFVQNPYKFYSDALKYRVPILWHDYKMPAVFDYETQAQIFKDRKFGREIPKEHAPNTPHHLKPFYDVEAHSMLELEPPRHTRLRGLVLRAFTSRRIAQLKPEIKKLAHDLLDNCDLENTDLLSTFATKIPVIIIARLLGVPETMADSLLKWSNDMVLMYQARRSDTLEAQAINSTNEFVGFMEKYIDEKRTKPADDLISHLIAAEDNGEKLTKNELISTCILLLNAGHEATVHTLGNGIKTLLEEKTDHIALSDQNIEKTIEEILRFDPPLHMFTRYCYENAQIGPFEFKRGDQVALVIGAAGRDPLRWDRPNTFDPNRKVQKNLAFGGGIHFCVGAPLARLELCIALPILFNRFPKIKLNKPPVYADVYHFHGLSNLWVRLST